MRSVPLVPAIRCSARIAILIAITVCFALPSHGQFSDASRAGGPVTITAPWRFHTGDNPQWAAPGFDDSQWPLVRMDKTWAEQGYKGHYGYAWYRMSLKLPAGNAPVALGFREIASADEIYADGRLIGTIGKIRPAPVWLAYSYVVQSFPLPAALNGRTVLVAIRVWQPKASATDLGGIGRTENPRLGTVPAIANIHDLSQVEFISTQFPMWIMGAVAAGIGLFSLGLFVLRRHATEYAWAALFLFNSALLIAGPWLYRSRNWPTAEWHTAEACFVAAMLVFWLLFIWRFLHMRADNLLRAAIVLSLFLPVSASLTSSNLISIPSVDAVWAVASLAIGLLVLARLVRQALQGSRDAQLLLVPFLLSSVISAIGNAQEALYRDGIIKVDHNLLLYRGHAFTVSWDEFLMLLSYLAVAALLMLRFARTAERDDRLSAEMEAAHSVQAQLVPAQLPATPHFRFDAAYFAASEVGGDFYQVYPQTDGTVLIAIGDVSGKGLKAAMLGTLVVGAFCSLVQDNLQPSLILARLNRQLAENSDGSFVTCCVARIDPDGMLTIANAGHLAPYRNGEEIPCESGLPLGLTATTEFAETTLQLAAGDKLTFLSDGVVEARDPSGELFGFQRTLAISGQTADQIARTAQDFGQQDDITVLTLSFAPASKPVEALHA